MRPSIKRSTQVVEYNEDSDLDDDNEGIKLINVDLSSNKHSV